MSAKLTSLSSSGLCSRHHRIGQARTVSTPATVKNNVALSARASTLERPMQEVIVQPEQQPEYMSLDEADMQLQLQFEDYRSATKHLSELEALSNELLHNLQELNEMEPFTPSPQPDSAAKLEQLEERRKKRAAAKEARKNAQARAPVAEVPAVPAAPKVSPVHVNESAVDAQLMALTDTKQRLQNLLQSSPLPAPTSTSLAIEASFSQTAARVSSSLGTSSSAASSVALQRRSPSAGVGLALPGPSVLPVPASLQQSAAVEPSAWAREKHQKRMRNNRRTAAVEGTKSSGANVTSSDITTQFMKRAATLDLLSGDGEKELTVIVKDLLQLERVKAQVRGILKREPTMAEWAKAVSMEPREFATRLSAGQQAKTAMMQANYRLVIAVCKRYQGRGLAMQDLITSGMQGLLKGVEKFDQTKGFRFSTYAHWWIRQSLTRTLSDQTRAVRLPTHVYEQVVKLNVAKAELGKTLGREPSVAQLAAHLEVTEERVQELLAASLSATSLDSPVASGDKDGTATMMDMLEDERDSPDDGMDSTMLTRDLENILGELNEREAGVLRMRFGLGMPEMMSLEVIGERFGITRERVRQIEAKALRKLQARHGELVGIMTEYEHGEIERHDVTGRSSRGTKKT